jgi:hypothetical protein
MRATGPLGTKTYFELMVEPQNLANRFKDVMLPPIFNTPMMIRVVKTRRTHGPPSQPAIQQERADRSSPGTAVSGETITLVDYRGRLPPLFRSNEQ